MHPRPGPQLLGTAFVYSTTYFASARAASKHVRAVRPLRRLPRCRSSRSGPTVQFANERRFLVVPAVALLTAVLTFPTDFLRLPDRDVINQLFRAGPLHENVHAAWHVAQPGWSMFIFIVRAPAPPTARHRPLARPTSA